MRSSFACCAVPSARVSRRSVRRNQASSASRKAVTWVRANFAQPMAVEALAELAHMSQSSFHQHFKAVTSMSPLQYQKVLRFHEARRLMLSRMMDAGSAGREVGYLSASQFSRDIHPPVRKRADEGRREAPSGRPRGGRGRALVKKSCRGDHARGMPLMS